jgi:hypothetical protein
MLAFVFKGLAAMAVVAFFVTVCAALAFLFVEPSDPEE